MKITGVITPPSVVLEISVEEVLALKDDMHMHIRSLVEEVLEHVRRMQPHGAAEQQDEVINKEKDG